MDVSYVIITLGGMATAGGTLVGVAHALSVRKKCDCSRTTDIEGNRVRLDNLERDTKRTWDSIQDLYGKHEKASGLYHEAQLILTRIIAKLEK